MSRLVIRCRSCTPGSAGELTDWLEEKVVELRAGTPGLLARLTRLAQDLPDATVEDGWLVELELPGDPAGEPLASLPAVREVLRDMRVLGLDPTLLVPVRTPFAERSPASASFSHS